jgi:hypothetical protein
VRGKVYDSACVWETEEIPSRPGSIIILKVKRRRKKKACVWEVNDIVGGYVVASRHPGRCCQDGQAKKNNAARCGGGVKTQGP